MNRAEKTRQYLVNQLARFNDMISLRNSKDAFFNSVKYFREEIIQRLRQSRIVDEQDIVKLDSLLAAINDHRNKSAGPNEVYWNAVGDVFTASVEKMNEIISKLSSTDLSINVLIVDFLKTNWKWVAGFVVAIITLIIVWLTYIE